MKNNFSTSVIRVVTLCVIITAVSIFFIYDAKIISWVVLALGLFCILALKFYGVSIKKVYPDIVFGLIDNGILAIFTVIGGEIAGIGGAIIGGTVGNAITDGIAGIFEGHIAERLRKQNISEKRTILGSSVGKMAGCLLGAGLVLVIASFINLRL